MRAEMLGSTDTYFHSVLDRDKHDQLRATGQVRLSYDATLAALFIHLYRDEPILHMPFRLLTNLVDIDDLFTNWRQRHAQMVLRMLGRKVGTGGSSGHEYLSETARKHSIFKDLHNISTLLIPRSALPKLPQELKEQLSFQFSDCDD
jgi:tryptophan 2,3-dioxygenase